MSAAGPPQGANRAPLGGSAAAALANEAASGGAVQSAAVLRVDGLTKSFGATTWCTTSRSPWPPGSSSP